MFGLRQTNNPGVGLLHPWGNACSWTGHTGAAGEKIKEKRWICTIKVSRSQPGLHCVTFLAAYIWLDVSEQAVWEEHGQFAVRQLLPIKASDHAGSGTSVIYFSVFLSSCWNLLLEVSFQLMQPTGRATFWLASAWRLLHSAADSFMPHSAVPQLNETDHCLSIRSMHAMSAAWHSTAGPLTFQPKAHSDGAPR